MSENTASPLLMQAVNAHQQGDLARAERYYLDYFQENQTDHQARDYLGMLYAQQQAFQQASHYFQAALRLAPNTVSYLVHLASALKNLDQTDQALDLFQQALALEPNNIQALNNLANLYVEKQEWQQAIEAYQQAIDIDPSFIDAHANIALAYLKLTQLDDAERHLLIVIEEAPEHTEAWYQLANIAYEQEQLAIAEHRYQQGLKFNPNHVPCLLNLAATLLKQEKTQSAEELYQQVILIEPSNTSAYNNLAAVAFSRSRYEEATQHYYDLLVYEPNETTAHFNLGVIAMRQRKWQNALYHFRYLQHIAPNTLDTQINLAAVLLRLQQTDLAIEHYQKALTLDPNNAAVRYTLQALTGETPPPAAPAEYITGLFDQYAENFDEELKQQLDYQVPQAVADCVQRHCQEKITLLDLGCGTGLCAAALQLQLKHAIGIDLSAPMLNRCQEKNIYDQLIQDDLINAMRLLEQTFDWIIAGDVLVYLGDLMPVFSAVNRLLTTGSYFAFTIEVPPSTFDGRYHLQPNGRYTHHPEYVKQCAEQVGLHCHEQLPLVLRQQKQHAVQGMLFLLQKP